MVVEFFEVVVGGCRSFLLLVTTRCSVKARKLNSNSRLFVHVLCRT